MERPSGAPFPNSNNSHKYLIETNPELTNLRKFLSSDYLLGLLGFDPDKAQKRLGDGLYEQRLIQNAVVARTGQRFINGLSSDEALFKYLMDNAIAYKDRLQLQLGVSLSAEQVAALTHDIVWLEEAEVNGEKVLVPVLYLAQSKGRLAPNGALIMGQDVSLISGGDLNNQGTLRASQDLAVSAKNLNNSGLIEASNRLDLLASHSIRNSQGGIISGRDVNLNALTGDVINERSISSLDARTENYRIHKEIANNAARIEASGDLSIDAGRDLINRGGVLQSGADTQLYAGRDVQLESATDADSFDYRSRRVTGNLTEVTQHASEVRVGGNLEIQAGRDLSLIASEVEAQGDIALSAGRDVVLASAANQSSQHNDYKGGGKEIKTEEDHVRQQSTTLNAGGDVLIDAGENLTLIASKIGAGNEAYLVAGDRIDLLAANDSDYSLYDMKEKGSFGSLKTQRDEVTDVKAVGSEISAGGDISLISGGDQSYQAARLESGQDIEILSGGSVTFEAVKDLHQESHEKSNSSLAWTSAKGEGKTDETLRQSELLAQGSLTIRAVDGLKIDYRELDQKSVSQAIDAMVQANPDLAWLKEAEARGDVDWRAVKELHDSFKYSNSGMGQGTMLVVAIIAAVATYGAASAFIGSGMAAGSALSAGTAATASSAATAAGWANVALSSGIASLGSTGATSLINNRGNLGTALKDTLSGDSLKQAMISAGVAGFMSYYGPQWFGGQTSSTTGTTSSTAGLVGAIPDLSNPQAWMNFAGMQLTQGALTGAANELLGQGSFNDAFKGSLYNILQGSVFHSVGDLNFQAGSAQNTLAHALAGGLLAEAMGGDFKTGAISAGASEALVNVLTSGFLKDNREWQQSAAEITGILAAAASNGDLQLAGQIAKSGMAYNFLNHEDVKDLEEALKGCQSKSNCDAVEREFSARSDANHQRLLGCVEAGNCAVVQAEIDAGSKELYTLYENLALKGENAAGIPMDLLNNNIHDWTLSGQLSLYEVSRPDLLAKNAFTLGQMLSFGSDFVPIYGDAKGFYEAETKLDYTLASIALVPVLGDALYKFSKFTKAVKRAKEIEAAKGAGAVIDTAPMAQRIMDVRAGLPSGLRRSGNVAVAEIDIPGIPKQMAAHSQVSDSGKGLIGSGSRNFVAQSLPNKAGNMIDRGIDTEYKILDNIADRLGSNTSARGTVNIFTEKAACASCLNVAEQFKAKYPNITINILDNQGVMLRPPRKTP